MKALHYIGPQDLRFVDVPTPEITEDEVLLKINKVGICGTDLHIYTGGMHVPTPLIMGHEFVGTIARVGGQVKDLQVGDRVVAEHVIGCLLCAYCRQGKRNLCQNPTVIGIHRPGALAEYLAIPAELVSVLPQELSFDEGVLVEPLSIAVYAVRRSDIKVGDSVAVIGQGPIGLLVDFVARAAGATVFGFDKHDNRLSYAEELKYIEKGVNVTDEENIEKFQSQTAGGADVVFEAVGSDTSADLALKVARPGGKVVVLGVFEHNVMVNMMDIVRKELEVYGSWTSVFSLDQTLQLLQSQDLDTTSFITHRYSFADSPSAFSEALRDKGKRIKSVIEFE